MLGPLIRAQLTAMLTKVLVDSPLFNAGVRKFDGTIMRVQQSAYDALLKATEEHDRKFPPEQPPVNEARATQDQPHRPRADESESQRDAQLRKLIEKTKKDIHDWHNKQ